MATTPNIPKIYDRKDIIKLAEDIICRCDRPKHKAHCPECGKVKLYGMSETTPAAMPDGNVISNCKVYRCTACGEKFNDVDWYFNCRAPKAIDWTATKKMQKEKLRESWMDRIVAGETFDWNTRQKCKAEVGFDPEQMRQLFKAAEKNKPTELTHQQKIDKVKAQIINQKQDLIEHPQDTAEIQSNIQYLEDKLKKLEDLL
jgi:hypothetical protein